MAPGGAVPAAGAAEAVEQLPFPGVQVAAGPGDALFPARAEARLATPEGPLLHRRRLGAELRRLRGERTLEEVAGATLISTSKLSRLENGQGVPQARDIHDLVAYFQLGTAAADRLRRWASAGRSQAWWRDYSSVLSANLDTYLDYESRASTIRAFAALVVPPLLQTTGYTVALQRNLSGGRSDEAARRLAEVRARRQRLLVESESASRIIAVLDEATLRRPIGSAADQRAQLDYLHAVSRQSNVFLTVVPFAAGAYAGLPGQFTILQYAEDIDRDIVAIESHTSERFLEQQSNVLEYLRIFDAISGKALDHDESRALIAEIRSNLNSPKDVP